MAGMTHDELPKDLRAALDALEARAAAAAERVDVAAVEVRVLERLRTEPATAAAPVRAGLPRPLLRLAAMLALLLVGAATATLMLDRGREGRDAEMAGATLPFITLDAFDTAQARAALAVVDRFERADTLAVVRSTVTVDDLNEQELRALLQALETEGLSL